MQAKSLWRAAPISCRGPKSVTLAQSACTAKKVRSQASVLRVTSARLDPILQPREVTNLPGMQNIVRGL